MAETTGNYIFRIHNDGASDIRIECWGKSSRLDGNKINTIEDVERKGASKVATSVPSPFARMHLFETAFAEVVENKKGLDGDSIYHQIVSDCLDVFQFLFNAGNNNPDIKYKTWNKTQRIEALKKGKGHPHQLLADTLELFFTGKFADVEDITLIYYKGILMGGTSPLTVFFTSPNWQREMEENGIVISSTTGNDIFFDKDYMPLHQRDPLFVEFMWKFYLAHRDTLNRKCEEFAGYIKKSIELNKKELYRKMNDEWSDYINNPKKLYDEYDKISITNSSAFLGINGLFCCAVKSGGIPGKIENESDFLCTPTIHNYKFELSDKGIPTFPNTPLVLAQGMNFPGAYTYDNTPWSPNTEIRRSSIMNTDGTMVPLSQRYLPGNSQTQYPFITTEDFLEETLIRFPFKLNTSKFYTGYSGDFNFALPIKKQYFNFFTKDDLKKNLEIIPTDSKVTVNLKVPIRNKKGISHITFTKVYDYSKSVIADFKAGIGIFPFYKIRDVEDSLQKLNDYTILVAEKNDSLKIEAINFWKTGKIIKVPSGKESEQVKEIDKIIAVEFEDDKGDKHYEISSSDKQGLIIYSEPVSIEKPEARTKKGITAGSYYYKVRSAFDLIEFTLSDQSNTIYTALVIPLFKEIFNRNATRKFTFAIDFGTSNSHIAYTDLPTDNKPKTFEISEPEMQMVLLNKPGESKIIADKYSAGFGDFPEVGDFVSREFIPAIIGKEYGSHVSFPIRTATFEKSSFEAEKPKIFTNINVGFYLDSDGAKPENSTYYTNLKWLFESGSNPHDKDRVRAFFEGLLLLIRNKALMNNGRIEDVQFAWLSPLSMMQSSIDEFADIWNSVFKEVFKGNCNNSPQQLSESVAPYFYLKNNPAANVKDYADAINIDIGGGTTDAMFFMKSANKYLSTSFRFAGNDIWGAGVKSQEKDNGFISNYIEFRKLSKQTLSKEDNILESFLRDRNLTSEDVTSLLFRYDEHFKFSESIKRGKPALRLIFFLHYSAIIYHLIQLIEKNKLTIPRYFTFTGKGSQYIDSMCSRDALNRFTKHLLSAYTTLEIPDGFNVVLTDNPKEATANGSVLLLNSDEKENFSTDSKRIETAYHWGSELTFEESYSRKSTKYSTILEDREFHKSTLKNLQTFIEKTLRNEDVEYFLSQYSISDIKKYEEFLTKGDTQKAGGQIHDSYFTVLGKYKRLTTQNIGETFFFYGLKDSLYFLSKHIVEQ